MRKFCQDLQDKKATVRYQRISAKNPINPICSIKTPGGKYTQTSKDTLEVEVSFVVHFQGSIISSDQDRRGSHTWYKIKWAIGSFSPFKVSTKW